MVPRGREAYREGLELRAEPCPARAPGSTELLPCRQIPRAELDRVHRELVRLGLRSMRSDPSRASSPHIGSRELALAWRGGWCAIFDGVSHRIDAAHERAFFDAIGVVLQAGPP